MAESKSMEITAEMELAGLMELQGYDPEEGGAIDLVRRIFLAMLASRPATCPACREDQPSAEQQRSVQKPSA